MRIAVAALVSVALAFLVVFSWPTGGSVISGGGLPASPAGGAPGVVVRPLSGSTGGASPVLPDLSGPGVTVIEPDGTISNSSAPITASGSNYTLTAGLTGTLLIERNGTRFDGGGHTLQTAGGGSVGLEVASAHDVQVVQLVIVSAGVGLQVVGSDSVSVDSTAVRAVSWAAEVDSSQSVVINNLSAPSTSGLWATGVSGLTIANCTLANSTQAAAWISNGSQIELNSNRASGSATGFVLVDTNASTILGNQLEVAAVGIQLTGSSHARIRSNAMVSAPIAIELTSSSDVNATGDTGLGGNQAIEAVGGQDLTFSAEVFANYTVGGLDVQGATNLSVLGSSFPGSGGAAITVSGSSHVRIVGNGVANATGAGINVVSSSDVVIQANNADAAASSPRTGILSSQDSNATITGNSAVGGAIGLRDVGSSEVIVQADIFDRAQTGVRLENDSSVELLQNHATGVGGNAIVAFDPVGLAMVSNNLSTPSESGIWVEGARQLIVRGNTIYDPGSAGLALVGGSDLTVTGTRVFGANSTGTIGIELTSGVGTTVYRNNLTGLNISFLVANATDLELWGNNASWSGTGFAVEGSVNATVSGNEVYHDLFAFNLSGDLALSVYHNNFFADSGERIGGSPGAIAWDAGYAEAGNFWSNHTGPDVMTGPNQSVPTSVGDGIVDTPERLGGPNEDRYPLTTPWSGFSIAFTESGLHGGTPWSVVVNGVTYSSGGSTILVPQQNGPNSTFWFAVPRLVGYHLPTPSAGSGADARGNLAIPIVFGTIVYPVVISEIGLPAGTPWTLVFAGHQYFLSSSRLNLSVSNGTYTYLPSTVPGYLTYGGAGYVLVAGGAAGAQIFYEPVAGPATAASGGPSTTVEVALISGIVVASVVAVLGWMPRLRRTPPT